MCNKPVAAWLLLAAAAIVGVLVWGIEQWVTAYMHIKVGLAPTRMGYRFYQLIMAGFSIVVLGLPAALIGAVLPLCLRREADAGQGLGGRGTGAGGGVARIRARGLGCDLARQRRGRGAL